MQILTDSLTRRWLLEPEPGQLTLLDPSGTTISWPTGGLSEYRTSIIDSRGIVWLLYRWSLLSELGVALRLPEALIGRCPVCYTTMPPQPTGPGRPRKTCSRECGRVDRSGGESAIDLLFPPLHWDADLRAWAL